ncbi:MAG: hypothetical protein AVDCRST_MAG49-4184, partial [uncultured Thermomicrobiales bacterium]
GTVAPRARRRPRITFATDGGSARTYGAQHALSGLGSRIDTPPHRWGARRTAMVATGGAGGRAV